MKTKLLFLFGILLFAFSSVAIYFLFIKQNSSNESIVTVESNSVQTTAAPEDGVVASLALGSTTSTDNNREVAGAQSVNNSQILKPTPLNDWIIVNEEVKASECDPSIVQTISVYKRSAETLTIYENSNPAGCNGTNIGDVSVDFDFTEIGFLVNKQPAYTQCTKEQNPTCPKGDGKVTVFLSNKRADGSEELHPKTTKSYAFSLEDTSIESDLTSQVNNLIEAINQITLVEAAP